MSQQILVVEDEKKIADLLKDYLENAGYNVSCLEQGDIVLPFVKKHQPNLILLDHMLPGMNGLDICREIRKFSEIPIIMVTAKSEEIDRLMGLELGADDYICKPFSPREVVARVKAVLKRTVPGKESPSLVSGPISLNVETRIVTVKDHEIQLTPSEFGLLKVLMESPNRIFSRDDLLQKVQGYEFGGYDRTIDTHIKNLRKKLALYLPNQELISAVYGAGYRFHSL